MPVTTDIPYSLFRSEERGGIDAYDFNVSFNFNDRVYLGLTVGAYDVDYSKYSCMTKVMEKRPDICWKAGIRFLVVDLTLRWELLYVRLNLPLPYWCICALSNIL